MKGILREYGPLIGLIAIILLAIASLSVVLVIPDWSAQDAAKSYQEALLAGHTKEAITNYVCSEFQQLAKQTVKSDTFFQPYLVRHPITVMHTITPDTWKQQGDTMTMHLIIIYTFNHDLPNLEYTKQEEVTIRLKGTFYIWAWCVIPPDQIKTMGASLPLLPLFNVSYMLKRRGIENSC